MFYTRYEGDFLSHKGVSWKARILQEADAPFASIGVLDFPAEQPLTIEWDEVSKEDSICGSVATLTIISPADRTYEDLYSITPGQIRLDIFRNGSLYWSGCLDPEFYEEPYSSGKNYDVALAFSDFGILKRIAYGATGTETLQAVVEAALAFSKINYTLLDASAISTYIDADTRLSLSRIAVRSDNFYDEDGIPMTYEEVLVGILQPLALRMVQKAGRIYLYDINALYASSGVSRIEWCSTDQMLGVDKVVNNAKITLSTYPGGDELSKEIEYTDAVDETLINLTNDTLDPDRYSYYQDYEGGRPSPGAWDYDWIAFTIFLSHNGSGIASKYVTAKYFRIVPILGGESSEGVALWFYTGGHGSLASGLPVRKCAADTINRESEVITTKRAYLPQLSSAAAANHSIRISLNMMLDARYNPFYEAGSGNESGNDYDLRHYSNDVFVPVKIQLYNEFGVVMYHYSNRGGSDESDVGWQSVFQRATINNTKGRWLPGPAAYDDCCFQWYDPKEKFAGSGAGGWKKNRQACGLLSSEYPSFKDMEDGQMLPYPPSSGYLEIAVCAGIKIYDESIYALSGEDVTDGLLPIVRWCLFQAPTVELLRGRNTASVTESAKDVEYTGVLNSNAKEDMSIDTVCGTMKDPSPLARGLYLRAIDRSPIVSMTRQGRTTQVEQLLIGTLYSQFASRKTKLSGTAEILSGGLERLSEDAQGQKRFMLVAETQDLMDDSSEIVAVEISPDEYVSNND